MVVLPDVRGLHQYYKELALRFAEVGVDAVAIDFFGRTDTDGRPERRLRVPPARGPDDAAPPSRPTSRPASRTCARRRAGSVRALFSVGFCFGGALSFHQAASGLGYAGVIGFYGWPLGLPRWPDRPKPIDAVVALPIPGAGDLRRRGPGHPARARSRSSTRPSTRAGVRARVRHLRRRAPQLLRPEADRVRRGLGRRLATGPGVRPATHAGGLTGLGRGPVRRGG